VHKRDGVFFAKCRLHSMEKYAIMETETEN
jgi:hypothetical protein